MRKAWSPADEVETIQIHNLNNESNNSADEVRRGGIRKRLIEHVINIILLCQRTDKHAGFFTYL